MRLAHRADPVLLVLATAVVLLLAAAPVGNNDTLFHLATGRLIATTGHVPTVDSLSFSSAGQPWVVHGWLWDLAAWLWVDKLGLVSLLLPRLLLVGAAFAFAGLTARREGASDRSIAAAFVLAACCGRLRFTDRPQVVSLVGIAALTWLLDRWRHGDRRPFRLVWLPLALVWGQCHALLLGLGLLGLEALESAFDRRLRDAVEMVAAAAVALLATVLLHPAGLDAVTYGTRVAEINAVIGFVEWQSLFELGLDHETFLVWLGVLALGIAVLGRLRREPRRAFRAAVFLAFVLRSHRFADAFALVALPTLALAFDRLAERGREGPAWATVLGSPALVCLQLLLAPASRPSLVAEPSTGTFALVDELIRRDPESPGYNDWAFGGLLLWADPKRPVLWDGRGDPFLSLLKKVEGGPSVFELFDLRYALGPLYDEELPRIRRDFSLVWFDDQGQLHLRTKDAPADALTCLLPEGPFLVRGAPAERCVAEAKRMVAASPASWRSSLLLALALARSGDEAGSQQALDAAVATPRAPVRDTLVSTLAFSRALEQPTPSWPELSPRGPMGAVVALSRAGASGCEAFDERAGHDRTLITWLADRHSPVRELRRDLCAPP